MSRFNAYTKNVSDFFDDILVVCNNCEKMALAKKVNNKFQISCTNCGFNKTFSDCLNLPNFKLWLTSEFKENKFWAYNFNHLNFLEKHITATLRERDIYKISNSSIGSRLPKWMTSKHNRVELLKVIAKLKTK